jgi:hypothetical protein
MTHPMDALFPGHSLFVAAASAAVDKEPLRPSRSLREASVSADPVLTKFVVVATPNGDELPILFPQVRGVNHIDMVPCGCSPVSAGFVMILGGTVTVLPIESTTLALKPRPQDKQLISALLNQ